MRSPAAAVVTTSGDIGTDTIDIDMSIDPREFGHIFRLLTDIYSDQILAVIREYSTNAWDAHAIIGKADPIEVTLPNSMSPFFVVRDFGVGMDLDAIKNIFANYGSSTKRNENISNGTFGIGGKAALTYTSQFTISSVKDGEKFTAMVQRVGEVPKIKIIDHGRPTSEPSGTKITVPVNAGDANVFITKANYFYSFWKPGTVIVNGSTPKSIVLDMVTDTIGTTAAQFGHDIVVLGNVPYPVDRRLATGRGFRSNFDVVAFVPMADEAGIPNVTIPPSRETLIFDARTESTLAKVAKEFSDKIRQVITDEIDSQPTHSDALKVIAKWSGSHGQYMPNPLTYRGTVIPANLQFSHSVWNQSWGRSSFYSRQTYLSPMQINEAVMIHDFNLKSLSRVHKDKINKWKQDNGISSKIHYLTEKPEGAPWADPAKVVSFDTIKAIVLPRNPSTPVKRTKPRVDVFDRTTGRVGTIDDLDPKMTPVYVSPTSRLSYRGALELYRAFPDIQIVSLGQNRWDKFKRQNPKAVELRDYILAKHKEAKDALTEKDLVLLGMNSGLKSVLTGLDDSLIVDKDAAEAIQMANGVYTSDTLTHYLSIAGAATSWIGTPRFNCKDKIRLSDFPLLLTYERGTMVQTHKILYINAVTAANSAAQPV